MSDELQKTGLDLRRRDTSAHTNLAMGSASTAPRAALVRTSSRTRPSRRRDGAFRRRTPRAVPNDDGLTPAFEGEDTPEWAKDLALDANGELVDTKTGKALNDFGATRFDVAVRAMRGEYDPPGVSTEKEEGQIYDTLTQFPSRYTFQASGRKADLDEDGIVAVSQIVLEVCGSTVEDADVKIKPRGSGGKFLSLWVTCTVHSAADVSAALAALKADKRVMTAW